MKSIEIIRNAHLSYGTTPAEALARYVKEGVNIRHDYSHNALVSDGECIVDVFDDTDSMVRWCKACDTAKLDAPHVAAAAVKPLPHLHYAVVGDVLVMLDHDKLDGDAYEINRYYVLPVCSPDNPDKD